MPDSHWENLKEIFHAAVVLPADERAAYLDKACNDNSALRVAVESLLKSNDETSNFVDTPVYEAAAEILGRGVELKPGQMVAHYRILSLLGEGGMGRVYLAEDAKLHRKVSLKFLSTTLTKDQDRLWRFEQEARAASALNHPNILTIHEIGETEGHRFIATEFIDGQTLRERLRSSVEIDQALEITIQVASALVAAHRAHIVHRDIKPENIMIRKDDGLVKVLDFGLAKMIQRTPPGAPVDSTVDTALIANTRPGVVMGTVAYMSPEQARGDTVDERTDIWSLGVLLYEMVACCNPFVAATSNEIISAILSKEPPAPLTRYTRLVPERLEEIVEKALAKNRDERYQTSKDLLIDLKRFKQSLDLKAGMERSVPREDFGFPTSGAPPKGAAPTIASTSSAEYIVNQVKSHKKATVAVASVLLILIITFTSLFIYNSGRSTASGAPVISSIAVLPFINASSDPDTDFISDGITDNIIERLAQLPNFRVMAHTAVFHYKGRQIDPRTIGSELNVEAVLTGRLTKRSDAITISLELVNAKDNSHIWGEQYDRKVSELLALQREIPIDVSDKLRLKLSGESKERLTRAHTDNPEAYQLYLKGRYAWEKWTRAGSKEAVQYFEEAIKKDPNYALAYAGLADAYMFGAGVGPEVPQKEAHRRAREAATKALSIDPQLGEAHAALAQVILFDDWDFSGAERGFKRAIELNPSYAEAHHQYSHLLLLLGRINESFVESQKFLELDPVSESPIGHLAYHYLYARQYDHAIQQYQKDRQLYPDSAPLNHLQLGNAYLQKGMFNEGVDEWLQGFARLGFAPDKIADLRKAFAKSGINAFYQKLVEQWKAGSQTEQEHVFIAECYARLGEKDQAFEWLEKAYAKRSDDLLRLKEELGFDNLRSDPRYADLLRRIGLPL